MYRDPPDWTLRHTAVVHRARKDGRVTVGVLVDEPPTPGHCDYAYVAETRVTGEGHATWWWHGSGGALTEETLGDDPPHGGALASARFEGALCVEFAIRLRVWSDDDDAATAWLAGAATLPAERDEAPLALTACGPREGGPFERTLARAVDVPRGPVLGGDAGVSATYSAALPGFGVLDFHRRALRTSSGEVPWPVHLPHDRDVYLGGCEGGVGGVLALWHRRTVKSRATGEVLTLQRPDGRAVHVELGGSRLAGCFDDAGARYAAVVLGEGMRVTVYDVASGRALATAPLPFGGDYRYGIAWHEGAAWVSADGVVTRLDPGTGAVVTRACPSAVDPGWRQYGAGAPRYHPGPDRTAWMVCAEFPREAGGEARGTTLVSWRDGDGAQGAVALADHGWAQGGDFGAVVVLADGRIVALGTRVWLVARDGREVLDLGPAGHHPDHPLVVRAGDVDVLYQRGDAPWYVALPR